MIDDLKRLPLMHGSLLLYKYWSKIQRDGVIAGGGTDRGMNTFSMDEALGRNKYVFIAPSCSSGDYGNGDCVVIHPDVLSEKDCHCFLHDPGACGGMIDQVRRCWQFGRSEFESWLDAIQDPDVASIVASLEAAIDPEFDDSVWQQRLQQGIHESRAFTEYYESQSQSVDSMYEQVKDECIRRSYSTKEYVSRNALEWPFSEEVLIRQRVEPDYILGRIQKRKWLPCPDAREYGDLAAFLSLMEVAQ